MRSTWAGVGPSVCLATSPRHRRALTLAPTSSRASSLSQASRTSSAISFSWRAPRKHGISFSSTEATMLRPDTLSFASSDFSFAMRPSKYSSSCALFSDSSSSRPETWPSSTWPSAIFTPSPAPVRTCGQALSLVPPSRVQRDSPSLRPTLHTKREENEKKGQSFGIIFLHRT